MLRFFNSKEHFPYISRFEDTGFTNLNLGIEMNVLVNSIITKIRTNILLKSKLFKSIFRIRITSH